MQINAVDCRTNMATATFLGLRRLAEDSVHFASFKLALSKRLAREKQHSLQNAYCLLSTCNVSLFLTKPIQIFHTGGSVLKPF